MPEISYQKSVKFISTSPKPASPGPARGHSDASQNLIGMVKTTRAADSKRLPPHAEAFSNHLGKHATTSLSVNIDNLYLEFDPDEVFNPPAPETVKPKPDWTKKIPAYLRDLPKPEWMVERDARLVAEAAKKEEDLLQESLGRNKAAKRAMVDIPAKLHLMLELAKDEKVEEGRLVQDLDPDYSLNSSDFRVPENPMQAMWENNPWQGTEGTVNLLSFSKASRKSVTGGSREEEKEQSANSLAVSGVEQVQGPCEWLKREQFVMNDGQREQREKWIAERALEALETPHGIDIFNPDWLSGELPVSGTRKTFQDYPEDLYYTAKPLEYGPVDWSKIPTLQPKGYEGALAMRYGMQSTEASVKALYKAKKKREEEEEKDRVLTGFLAAHAPSVLEYQQRQTWENHGDLQSPSSPVRPSRGTRGYHYW